MAVLLNRAYGGFAANSRVIFSDDTESALVAQGWASALSAPSETTANNTPTPFAVVTQGGNVQSLNVAGQGNPAAPQGPRILPNGTILAFASLGTNTTLVAGTLYRCEIFVPYWATWTGIGLLNGATVGTNNHLVALYDSNGVLIANSDLAGTVSANANTFQQRAFTSPTPPLAPGRYFIAMQANGTTATLRTWAAANGGNMMTASSTGTFGTLPASFTPPTTFTADVGPIAHLYQ
jgi:hypothetical protein